MKKLLYFLPIFAVLACQSTTPKEATEPANKESFPPASSQQNTVARHPLNAEQLEKIDFLYETFKEVDPAEKIGWINDFERDPYPDRELEIWLAMATAFTEFCGPRQLDYQAKEEVYKILLLRSSSPPEEVLAQAKLEFLTQQEAQEVMDGYTLDAKPVVVKKPVE